MYRHCIKYFCLAQLESVLANLTVMLIDLRLKPILYFIYLLFLTLSVSSFFREILPVALAQILSVSVRYASWP
jgi:hypothetical protein